MIYLKTAFPNGTKSLLNVFEVKTLSYKKLPPEQRGTIIFEK